MKIIIRSFGKLKSGPLLELVQEYKKRITSFNVTIEEFDNDELLARHPKDFKAIALDSSGVQLTSQELSYKINSYTNQTNNLMFLIGGPDGLKDSVLKETDFKISFGKVTWPHLMVRVMLLEQIYRSQQIANNHPYHKYTSNK